MATSPSGTQWKYQITLDAPSTEGSETVFTLILEVHSPVPSLDADAACDSVVYLDRLNSLSLPFSIIQDALAPTSPAGHLYVQRPGTNIAIELLSFPRSDTPHTCRQYIGVHRIADGEIVWGEHPPARIPSPAMAHLGLLRLVALSRSFAAFTPEHVSDTVGLPLRSRSAFSGRSASVERESQTTDPFSSNQVFF